MSRRQIFRPHGHAFHHARVPILNFSANWGDRYTTVEGAHSIHRHLDGVDDVLLHIVGRHSLRDKGLADRRVAAYSHHPAEAGKCCNPAQ